MLIHRVLPIKNPSFDEFLNMMNGQLVPGPPISGISRPKFWTLGGQHPFYTDVEKYTRRSEYGLKISGGAGPGSIWMMQKIEGLAPGEEYGFAGWAQFFEPDAPPDALLLRCGGAFALTTDFINPQDLQFIPINAKKNEEWVKFGSTIVAPSNGVVYLCCAHHDIVPGINISYWDHFDDPEWP